jgi:flagellum-specific ATP synthase
MESLPPLSLILELDKYRDVIASRSVVQEVGKVTRVVGFVIEGYLPGAALGCSCIIHSLHRDRQFSGEVIGFHDKRVLIMSFGEIHGVGNGSQIELHRAEARVQVGPQLLGRVLNGLGEPIDSGDPLDCADEVSIYSEVVNPLTRPPIDEPLDLGVRAINGLITVGKGQRIGIMAGSGVGKSVLMGMIARSTNADVNVIALIGERGRELREFVEKDLGPEGLKRSVVVVATSDQTPLVRMRGAFVAMAIAEYFAHEGKNVLLMMDSVTRFAMAQREIGLSAGEPPATKGYTPSVFAMLPKLLERAGRFSTGSITGLYTVLVDGDDMNDPIGDAVRSIVDGHIVLSRDLAHKGQFPAIDVLQSTSRVMRSVTTRSHQNAAIAMRECLATYKEAEDLINIGAYKRGTNPRIDAAIDLHDPIIHFLKQAVEDPTDFETTEQLMHSLVGL